MVDVDPRAVLALPLPQKAGSLMHYLEFLAQAHSILQPRGYLEIGVRYGDSLRLAQCPALGIDPAVPETWSSAWPRVASQTSDEFFAGRDGAWLEELGALDLAFIDGMHLIENALRDFVNIEKYSNKRTVVIFDDVLPYNQEIASRTPPPGGDWTGDVWQVWPILNSFRPDLDLCLVDTQPTGLLLVTGLDPQNTALDDWRWPNLDVDAAGNVPSYILRRLNTATPREALDWLTTNRDSENSA